MDPLGRLLPQVAVGRFAVGDEKNPGPVVGNAVGLIVPFALLDQVQRQLDAAAHGGLPGGDQGRRNELISGDEILNHLGAVAERDHGDLDPEQGEFVLAQLFAESDEPGVEGGDGRPVHGARGVQQQNTSAAGFGVAGEFNGVEVGGHVVLLIVIPT